MSEPTDLAVDTSVAVAYLDARHSAHASCVAYLRGHSACLSGHAAFEAFAVLTRLPGTAQVQPSDARHALHAAFGDPVWLPEDAQQDLFARLGTAGFRGAAVHDALVGEAARLANRVLVTRDRRAIPTYQAVGVTFALVES